MEQQEQQPQVEPVVETSFSDRLLNVFTSPSAAFAGLIESTSRAALWVVPLLISLILAAGTSYLIFSNETLRAQVMEQQIKALDQRVADGKMTQAQADQAREYMENPTGSFMMIIGMVTVVIGGLFMFFVMTTLYWLIGKVALKTPAGYGPFLAAYGISAWISIVGTVVTMVLMVGLGSMYATPSLAILVYQNFEASNRIHGLLSAINVFVAWQSVVMGLATAKLSNKSAGAGYAVGGAMAVLSILVIFGFTLMR